jgi:formate/nitrite transporter FocA (FNT family)
VVPVLTGNIVGGGALVAMLNHAQVHHEVPAAHGGQASEAAE